jgi:hypothetical protein
MDKRVRARDRPKGPVVTVAVTAFCTYEKQRLKLILSSCVFVTDKCAWKLSDYTYRVYVRGNAR